MAIRNKRTSIGKTEKTVEQRLRAKLKEDYDSFLQEDDDEEEDLTSDDTDDVSDMEADPTLGDDESTDDIQLTQDQEEFMDDEIDKLLAPSLEKLDGGIGDDLALDTNDDLQESNLMEDDDMLDDDLSIEDTADDIDGDITGGEDDFSDNEELGEPDFTAEELNAIIDSPNTLDSLESSLEQKALAQDDLSDDGLGLGDDDDNEIMESLMEADLVDSLEDLGYEEETIGLDGDEGEYDKSTDLDPTMPPDAKGEVSDKVKFPGEMKKNGYSQETDPETEVRGDNVAAMVKESIKKSKMLVKAAAFIVNRNNTIKKLQLENKKLNKVNGIFSAVGEKLSKATRKKIAESFEGCKTEKDLNSLYTKVVKVITEKKQPTLNEAVQNKKTFVSRTVSNPKGGKLNESSKPTNKELTNEQKRKNYLMGFGKDDMYFA